MKSIPWHILIVLASLLTGCVSAPIGTISGNPEIILTNVNFMCVRNVMMNSFVDKGYSLRNVSNTQIVAGKKSNSAPIWYHTFYLGAPEERITIDFIQMDIPDTLRVVSTAAYVSDPGTASERVYPVKGRQEDMEELLSIHYLIENRCRKKIDFGNSDQ